MGSIRYIDQFCAGFSTGDAISNEALILQRCLRDLGYKSEIYCEQYTDRDSDRVLHFRDYHKRRDALLIYHHSFYTEILNHIGDYPARKILIFHNITPPEYVRPYNRHIADQLGLARTELAKLSAQFQTVLADSRFNADELLRLGFQKADVLPVALDFDSMIAGPVPDHMHYLTDGKANIIFVGRVFPNKKHQDLIKVFYYFNKIRPDSRMIFVGAFHPGVRGYTAELNNLTSQLGLSDSIIFTGMVSPDEILSFYANSHLFLSMSEHEGFFVPLLESMHFQIPILAYGSSVIPETMGDCGVIFHEKNYCMVAEMMNTVLESAELKKRILEGQNKRLSSYSLLESLNIFKQAVEGAVNGR